MVHSGRQVAEDEQPLVLVEAKVVFRIVEEIEQRTS
jgi:hypothetical protein